MIVEMRPKKTKAKVFIFYRILWYTKHLSGIANSLTDKLAREKFSPVPANDTLIRVRTKYKNSC